MSAIALAQLGEIAELQAGVGFPVHLQGRSSGGYPVAKVGDISRVGRSGEAVISAADHYVDEIDLARLKARPIPPGSVLFAKIGMAIRQNHRVITGCALLIDNNAMAAIPTKRVVSRYLYHFLRTVDFYGLASATTVPALRKSELQRLPVPLPEIAEQKRIARILDAADALRAKRREAVAQFDALARSTFLDMFGDPVTNPMRWKAPALGEVTDEIYRYPTYYGITYENEGVPEIRGELIEMNGRLDIDRGKLRFISQVTSDRFPRTQLAPGDLVMSVRGTIGKIGIVPNELVNANITANLIRISPARSVIDPVFLLHVGLSQYFIGKLSEASSSTTIKTIKAGDLAAISIPLPPLVLQRRFVAMIQRIEQQKSLQLAHSAELDTLFASLQSHAFRGGL